MAYKKNTPTQIIENQNRLNNTGKFVMANFTGIKGQGVTNEKKTPYYKLGVSITQDNGYVKEMTFKCYTPLKNKTNTYKGLQVMNLEFGKEYNFGYNDNTYFNQTHNKDVTEHIIFFIGLPKVSNHGGVNVPVTLTGNNSRITNSTPKTFTPTTHLPKQETLVKPLINKPVVKKVVLPEEQQLWDNNSFGNEEEWMTIAEDSGIFDSEERAKEVFKILNV